MRAPSKPRPRRSAQRKTGRVLPTNIRTDFGPAAVIVPRTFDYHVLRYDQGGGLSLPLLGSKIEQQLAIIDAAEQEQLAVIQLNQLQRAKIAALRKAYTEYWSYDDQARVGEAYVGASQSDITTGRSLLHTGFFTGTDLMDINSSVQKVQFNVASLRALQRSELANVSSAVGYEMGQFQPAIPSFFDRCAPDRDRALQSAYAVDPQMAGIAAEDIQVNEELARVKGSSITASTIAEIGSTTDINAQVSGYRLDVGVSVALPTHGRDEERALRAQYLEELKALGYRQTQRKLELAASIDADLDNIKSAETLLNQAGADVTARQQDLRNAQSTYAYVREKPEAEFLDVHTRRSDVLTAQTAVSVDRENVLLYAADLLTIAPGACGARYEAIPPMVLPTKPPRHRAARAAAGQPAKAALPAKPIPTPAPMPKPTTVATPKPAASTSPAAKPDATNAALVKHAAVPNVTRQAVQTKSAPAAMPSPKPSVKPSPSPRPSATPKASPSPSPLPKASPSSSPRPAMMKAVQTKSAPAAVPSPKPNVKPTPTALPKAAASPKPSPSPRPRATPKASPLPSPSPKASPSTSPRPAMMKAVQTKSAPAATPSPKPSVKPTPSASPKATASPRPSPTPRSAATPKASPSPSPLPKASPSPSASPSPQPLPAPAPEPVAVYRADAKPGADRSAVRY